MVFVMVVRTYFCDICGSQTKKLKKITMCFSGRDRSFDCCCDCFNSVRRLIYRDLWNCKAGDFATDMIEHERCSCTQSIPRHALSDN